MLKKKTRELIKKLAEKVGVNEKVIEEKVKAKIKEYDYFISEESALRIVAKELGVGDFFEEKKLEGVLKIRDLKPGFKGIKIRGKVLEVSEVKKSSRGDKYKYLVVSDDSGILKVYFWENKIKDVEEIEEGDLVEMIIDVLEGRFGVIGRYKYGIKVLGKEEIKEKEREKIEWKLIKDLEDEERALIKGVIVNKLSNGYIINDLSGEIVVRSSDYRFSIGDLVYCLGVYSKSSKVFVAEKMDKLDINKEINFLILKLKDEVNRES